nr:immunoglobulin heavy chain junction region [Mus musculus]
CARRGYGSSYIYYFDYW